MAKNVFIIGAGLAGLASAALLAHHGYTVNVYEQAQLPGGKAGQLKLSGFRFDTGPSLLTMPFVLEDLFKELNENLSDYLTLQPLQTICKYYYPDGTEISAYADKNNFAREIGQKTGDRAESIHKYLEYAKRIYHITADIFLFSNIFDFKTYINIAALKSMLRLAQIDSLRTMHQANASFFKDNKTIQMFDRYATYNGSNPYIAPATLNVIQHVEFNLGSYIPKEGIYSIPKALFEVAQKKGVHFHFSKKVKKMHLRNERIGKLGLIDLRNQNSVEIGIKDYDTILSNADVNNTLKELLDKDDFFTKRVEPSTSALVFYWGVNFESSLEIHNILFSAEYRTEFNHLKERQSCPQDPTIYIYISSKYKKGDASPGMENWFVMINTPFNQEQDWDREIKRIRPMIISKINRMLGLDIESKILCEKTLSPADIESKTGSFKGSIYGNASNSKFSAFLRHPAHSSSIKNLYFCGGSVHPGGGIPLVLLSAKHAVKSIMGKS